MTASDHQLVSTTGDRRGLSIWPTHAAGGMEHSMLAYHITLPSRGKGVPGVRIPIDIEMVHVLRFFINGKVCDKNKRLVGLR